MDIRNIWNGMIQRCTNPNSSAWKYYGGRGITVCDRWRGSYAAFAADMGPRPDGTSIDRINNDGNYEPGNCRWATPAEQNANRRPPVRIGRFPRTDVAAGRRFEFRMTPQERERWQTAAAARGLSVAELVRAAVEARIAELSAVTG